MKSVIYSALARAFGLIPQGIATLLASTLILRHFGIDAFSAYVLVSSVILLIPVSNLGVGASLTQAVSIYGVDDERSQRAGLTGARVLAGSSLLVIVVAGVLGLLDLWPSILGDDKVSNGYTTLAIIVFALTFVMMLGSNVLLAVGRNHVTVLVQSLLGISGLAMIGIVIAIDASPEAVVAIPSFALLVVALTGFYLSSRLAGFKWLQILRRVPFRDRYPGMSVRALTLPVMITQLCIPIAFAGDRLILSHVSTEYQVSKYSLLLQIFVPITGLIVAAAQPLWPMFTRARVNGEGMPRMRLILVAFVVGTALVSLVLVIISPPLGKAISGGEIDLGYALPALTAVVACMQALVVPMSMGMVDPKGVRFVAIWSVIAVPVSLVVSIWFASMWGATGVMLSAAFVGGSVQLIPIAIYSVRRSRQAEPVDLF